MKQTVNNMDKKELLTNLYKECAALLNSLMVGENEEAAKYDRIVFIGAHGTGKSTLANELSKVIGMPVVESVAREANKNFRLLEDEGVIDDNIPEVTLKNAYQKVLCSMAHWDFMRWVNAGVPYSMTRCPLDTIAYAMADNNISLDTVSDCSQVLHDDSEFLQAIQRSLFIYIPIEFGIENDGVRPTDVAFQKKVDECMRKLIYSFGIAPFVVSGSVDERLESIIKFIFDENLGQMIMDSYRKERKG